MNDESSEFISPEYLFLVKNLIKRKDNAKTLVDVKKTFTDFAKKYTLITYLFRVWKKSAATFENEKQFSKCQEDMNNLFKGYFENPELYNTVVVSHKIDIFMRDISGFCSYLNPSDPLMYSMGIFTSHDLNAYRENIERFKRLIQIPHRNMEFTFKNLNEYSEFPLDADMLKKYEKARELHQKMIEADETSDHEKWFKYLLESNDQKCIKRNILYRISKYPFVKKLWTLYIEYLETTDLQVFKLLKDR
jgi:tetratricopeptide (TPR) repeat protein